MKTVTLADFRPSRRADGLVWTKAKVETAATGDATVWQVLETVELTPLDLLPLEPMLRSFTVSTSAPWLRVVFIDMAGGEEIQAVISTSGHPFRPLVSEIAAILRARTYSKGVVDPDEPLKALAGGELVEEFTDQTRPTAASVEKAIDQACTDVSAAVGDIPGEKVSDARRVAALRASAECERAYIPDETESRGSIYQTLRLTADEKLEALRANLWAWTLANRGMQ